MNRYYFERCKLTVQHLHTDTSEPISSQVLGFWGLFDRHLGRDAPIAYVVAADKAQKIVDALNGS